MADVISERTEGQLDSSKSSATQFVKESEITEKKPNENLRKKYSIPPNKISPNWLRDVDKVIKDLAAKTIELERSLLEEKKKNVELEKKIKELRKQRDVLALNHKPTDDQSTQTEAPALFTITPAPPKEGMPPKNGRHHKRYQTYPFHKDGMMPLNKCPQRDVGIQTVLFKPMKYLPALSIPLKPESNQGSSSDSSGRPGIDIFLQTSRTTSVVQLRVK